MADLPRQIYWNEGELEEAVSRLGHRIDYPPTPDLAVAVRRRIADSSRRPAPWWSLLGSRRAVAVAVFMLLLAVVVTSVLAFSPATRTAIADRLGLRGLLITTEQPMPTPLASPVGDYLRLGNRMTLNEVQSRVPFHVLVPGSDTLGMPDEVYLSYPPVTGQVALIYRARAGLPAAPATGVGLLLTQFQGELEPGFLGKGLGRDTRLTPVTVNGGRGFWIDGESHAIVYRDPSGNVSSDFVRLAGNVLVWEQNGLIVRLESDISMEEALRIAESVR